MCIDLKKTESLWTLFSVALMLSLSVLLVLLSTVNNTSGVSVVMVLMVMLSSVENHVFKCCQELTVCVSG